MIPAQKTKILHAPWHSQKKRKLDLFPGGSVGKESGSEGKVSACSAGDLGLIPGSGRSLGEGNGNPLQNSCLENPLYRGALQATVHDTVTYK